MTDKETTLNWLSGDQAAMQPETFVNPMVKALIEGSVQSAAAPGQYMTPNPYPPGSEEASWYEDQRVKGGHDWATKTAMGMMGAGAPMAENNAAGVFGGKLAKTANLDNLKLAESMEAKGSFTPEHILDATGWFKHPTDNQWRFEIPDHRARVMNAPDFTQDANWVKGPTSALLSHPELYKAYPHLENVPMSMTTLHNPVNGIGVGQWHAPSGIEVHAPNPTNAKSIALHEVQHAIQEHEGFSPGGSPSTIAHYQEKKTSKVPLQYQKTDPLETYQKLAGEVESRNVQARAFQSPEELRAAGLAHPHTTMDTPFNQQIAYDRTNDILKMLSKP